MTNNLHLLPGFWERQRSDWGFGQLMMNVLTRDPFHNEDDELDDK